jgi:AcrR family transcriptional regulator
MSGDAEQDGSVSAMTWTERAADRSPLMKEWRVRNARQMQAMVEAAKRLIARKGGNFTTQELAREAGVAVQTFYRHFGGKDQLLLATLEDLHAASARGFEEAARDLPDPLARLHYYLVSMLTSLDESDEAALPARFVTAEHWRLHQQFPDEVAIATQQIVNLFARQIQAAQEQGLIPVSDVARGAEMMVILVRGVYHEYAFKTKDETTAAIAENVWNFCLQGLGGRTVPAENKGAGPSS